MLENIFNFSIRFVGRALSLCVAAALLMAWAATGPLFRLSDLYRERFNKKVKGTL
ncbi:MAG TPA: hypothetical protein VN516_10615 [Candidatus Baltobacteraceae bacterium]|nr:hypothetical protein [Candidatus Baltobacteraceae bacterium]